MIVSNSAGTRDDPAGVEADLLERNTGVSVLRHSTKKPGCGPEVLQYFRSQPESGVTKPSQIAIVGDRLFTDVMMANMMGSWNVWIKDGVVDEKGLVRTICSRDKFHVDPNQFTKLEGYLADSLKRRGYYPPVPLSPFED